MSLSPTLSLSGVESIKNDPKSSDSPRPMGLGTGIPDVHRMLEYSSFGQLHSGVDETLELVLMAASLSCEGWQVFILHGCRYQLGTYQLAAKP